MILQENISLAPLTTFGVGGEARYFAVAESFEEVIEALDFARARALPVFVLGGGSNILVADSGFDGLVLSLHITGIAFEKKENKVLVTVGAGVVWDEFVEWSIAQKFGGLECLSGIPGTVGGAVVANLGAYGAQASDTFVSAEVLDKNSEGNAMRIFKNDECDFSYHDSSFSHASGRYLVLRATFALSTELPVKISYRDNRFDLAALAAESGRAPTQSDVRNEILKMRGEKGVLQSSYKSAGSFFHMPFVSAEKYAEVLARAQSLDAEKEEKLRPWAWKQPDGSYKIAAGFLLEYTEFQKGYARGGAGISPKHTLAIINVGGATARGIAQLARDMQESVERIFGIQLEREVEYVGAVEQ
jgi:UDP-N-acetylmuramate dehydrogenase